MEDEQKTTTIKLADLWALRSRQLVHDWLQCKISDADAYEAAQKLERDPVKGSRIEDEVDDERKNRPEVNAAVVRMENSWKLLRTLTDLFCAVRDGDLPRIGGDSGVTVRHALYQLAIADDELQSNSKRNQNHGVLRTLPTKPYR